MENDYFYDIENLKKKYEYNRNDYERLDDIYSELRGKCIIGICFLIEKLEEFIQNLEKYEGSRKEDAKKYLIKMKKKLNYYKFVKIKLFEDCFYYKDLIREFQAHLIVHSNIWKMKEVCMKNLKEILDSQVLNFINFD